MNFKVIYERILLFRDHIESTFLFVYQKSNGSFSKALPLQNIIRRKRTMLPSEAVGNIACHVARNNKTSKSKQ